MSIDWLYKEDEYTPPTNHQKFIDKSIIGLVAILSKIKKEGIINNPIAQKVSPIFKVLFSMILILLVSLSRSYFFVGLVIIYNLIIILTFETDEKKEILTLSIVIPLFTLIMLIPSMFMGNIKNSILIIIKVFASISIVNLLSHTTKWNHITKTLKLFYIPDLFIWILEITIKYIFILGNFSLEMLYALKLRSVGENTRKYTSLSSLIGSLFLKSMDMGEEMFAAMECRCFTGEYKTFQKFKLKSWDIIYISINMFIFIAFWVI